MNVTVVIPTLNEEKGIGGVVESFKSLGFDVLVIDGNSKDRTREIAEKRGAKVVLQTGKGKGNAIAEAFKLVDSDIVVLVDGDGSYPAEEVWKLIEPIEKGVADHVVGNRFAKYEKGAFTKLNLLGNKLINLFFRFAYGVELTDILSGYRAIKKEVYKSIEIRKSGFEVEAELTVETLAKGFRIVEVPISYKKREGKTKLRPIRDGIRIGKTIYELIGRYSPARYLYIFGLIFLFLGIATGCYVVYAWLKAVSHYMLALLTVLFIVTGVQFIVIGLIADLIFRATVEFRREVRQILRRKGD
ncbi:MAG: S-layer glycoprotein N-glycosyltransferase AglJ [Archaeoglobaceae archaeon]